jgi:hypothetical protein
LDHKPRGGLSGEQTNLLPLQGTEGATSVQNVVSLLVALLATLSRLLHSIRQVIALVYHILEIFYPGLCQKGLKKGRKQCSEWQATLLVRNAFN